jgi:glycosyltransferase involved in cell wall biosynthesis
MPKVLVITYYWPPSSGAGVQRWLKFSKYLPSFGWEPVILSVDPDCAAYPATDRTLEKDVNDSLDVVRTRATDYFRFYKKDKSKVPSAGFASSDKGGIVSVLIRFIRGNLFIPDPRKGWNSHAFKKACELIEKNDIGHVITTSPPHSTQLIGLKLKKKYPYIRWIADLRDPWTDIYYYSLFLHTPLAKAIDRGMEKKVLEGADALITVGDSLAGIFRSKLPAIKNKITVITNGYDEDDFTGIETEVPEVLTITYVGTLSDAYPLTGFLKAAAQYISGGSELKLRFVGTVSSKQTDLIISMLPMGTVEFIPYVDHLAAIRFMHETTVLLLIIPDHATAKGILTGKLFEYLASRRPVLCLGPVEGDAAEIISETSSGATFEHSDSGSILNFLAQSGRDLRPDKSDISGYSRRNLTERLSNILAE